jgi:D-beta-D-heptose 7-phosphate kinase/D-beta-D-heptose 1-phosphate adenosyltransferase
MVSLFGSFSRIKKQKIMVIGDLVLDTYTIGKAKRISPEAPVAVLHVNHEEHRPGMAGNVALNLISMGAEVVIIGRVGNDAQGKLLVENLSIEGIDTSGIISQQGFPTPIKNRVIANNQQIVRVDYEQTLPLPELLEQQVIESLPALLEGVSLIAVSDYGKGFVTRTLMSSVIEIAKQRKIPVVVDPKGVDFTKYSGADVVKPNLSEVFAAANLPPDSSIDLAAERVLQAANCKALMVTRSEAGISLFYPEKKREDFPVRIQEVKDVTGAGDTVLAMLTCSLANGLSLAEGSQLSNIAAGIAIERFGCARVTLSDLARRLLRDDIDNKVFDEEHLFALQEALKGRRYVLLGLSSSEGFTTQTFSAIRKLAQKDNWDLLVYVNDVEPDAEVIDVLASLHDVDYIIVKSEGLRHLCKLISPDEIYEIRDQQLRRVAGSEEFLKT